MNGELQKVQVLSSYGAKRGPVDPEWPPEDDLEPPLSSAEQCSLLKACAPDASWATALVLVCSKGDMLPQKGLAQLAILLLTTLLQAVRRQARARPRVAHREPWLAHPAPPHQLHTCIAGKEALACRRRPSCVGQRCHEHASHHTVGAGQGLAGGGRRGGFR